MADTYEKDLAQKSSLTVNDFIRVVGTDNVSYKQLVSDVAKKIIENYTGSSLAGSSQSVKSALDALNSKSVKGANKSYTVTVSAGGYTFLTDYETLGIDADRIVGYIYKAGSYPIVLQFATEGIYLFSSSAISNKSISIKYFYV